MAGRPRNLISLPSDEMRGDTPGFMGNPHCKTRRLGHFAERSVVFNRHFAVHGKCVPALPGITTPEEGAEWLH